MNLKEVETGITLANKFSDIIVAVNVGNEALVEWNDHLMDVDTVISYVKNVQKEIEVVPVTEFKVDWIETDNRSGFWQPLWLDFHCKHNHIEELVGDAGYLLECQHILEVNFFNLLPVNLKTCTFHIFIHPLLIKIFFIAPS